LEPTQRRQIRRRRRPTSQRTLQLAMRRSNRDIHQYRQTRMERTALPGTSIEQFGLDLLRRILAADVERLYDAAIDDVCANQYGVIPKNKNPMDLICMKYTHPLSHI
jgi:hypothetical protein